MKHLFIAHSHTLTLCSLGTIEYLNLNPKDCIFICTRGYKIPDGMINCKVIDANDFYNEFDRYIIKNIFYNRKRLKEYDKCVSEWTCGDEFHFYPPHLWGYFFSLMCTHKKCKKVSLVQEGAYTIKGYFHLNIGIPKILAGYIKSILKFGNLRGYSCNGWYANGALLNQKYIDVYSVSEHFFQYMPERKTRFHKIKWPQYNQPIKEIIHKDAPIFVFDGYIINNLVDKEVYLNSCKRIITEYCKINNYVKFHPAQTEEERNFIMGIFGMLKVNSEVFYEDVPFEFYLANYKKMEIIGFGSSLLYFAKDLGHNVKAHSSWLLESEKFRYNVSLGYPVFDNF